MSWSERFAPAKVNLYLHVGPPGSDGYHPLNSLVSFADIGDRLSIARAPVNEVVVTGPFASALTGENLIARARDRLLQLALRDDTFRITLDKRLPVASGIGGGSADAAAALQLLAIALTEELEEEVSFHARVDLYALALELGADVPVCFGSEPRIMEGRGERLSFPPTFPALDVVLVNPGVATPTGRVFAAYDEAVTPDALAVPSAPEEGFATVDAFVGYLRACRNDLQAPAVALTPVVGEVLVALEAAPETRLARMSGSGATCFAICASADEAGRLAGRLSIRHPAWWVRPCRLKDWD